MSSTWVSKIGIVLKTYNNLSEKDKKVMSKTVKQIVTSYRKAIREDNKKEIKQKIDKLKKDTIITRKAIAKNIR